ncbi:N-acyl-D-amino-acid deacylase family protein [Pseudonocardia xishanensis]|uniref:Amidohydrolase family protein n=1 Tax=Pseudonocardia xishanensis TaxID=630995 RepID=A0ABP8RYI5_9PSEU
MAEDLVIRGGTIVDGTGADGYRADVGVRDGRITEIGRVPTAGRRVVDASGCVVTPGFVDVHTHYDGQSTWSDHLDPSSRHGVTTAVLGNCGVGFAPCRAEDHALLVNAMEGVEDIPEVVMTTGLPWDWETFPEYLDALDQRARDIDVAVLLPHSPLRVYAMGQRGADREPATDADLDRLCWLAEEGLEAGAIGFATSRTAVHRRGDGEHIPSFRSADRELLAIARAMGGNGIVQMVTSVSDGGGLDEVRHEVHLMRDVSRAAGVTVTFSISQQNAAPHMIDTVLSWTDAANEEAGVDLRPQFAPRPIGVHMGFALSANPFSASETYQSLADLPLPERLVELRKPEVRERIVTEPPSSRVLPLVSAARQFERTYVMTDPPTYEPPPDLNIATIARQKRTRPEEVAYDALLADDGQAMLYVAFSNYAHGNLDHIAGLVRRPDSIIGLGDGGAHYGMICDASYPTFVLTHWARDRPAGRLTLAEAVRELTSTPADAIGLRDRGRITLGGRADINVIEHDRMSLPPARVVHDLPGRGRRLAQHARGYRHTFVAGQEIVTADEYTGALPGRLVRGRRQ